MALQNLRSSTANKRPVATSLADGQIAINTNAASPGIFFNNSSNVLTKVGPIQIGTSAPNSSPAGSSGNAVGEQWLDTSGSTVVLKIWDGSAWQQQNQFGAVTGSAAAPSYSFTGDSNTGIYSPGADQVAISTGGSGRLFIDSSGRVGVGTSSFSTGELVKFYQGSSGSTSTTNGLNGIVLERNSDTGLTILTPDANIGSIAFGDDASASIGRIRYLHSSDAMLFQTNGSERARIDSSGNVGIGTSSPNDDLEIRDSTAAIRITDSDNNEYTRIVQDFATTQIINTGGGDIRFSNNGSERLRIDSSGRVGIGSSAPATRLHVEGTNNGECVRFDGNSGAENRNLIFSNANNSLRWILDSEGAGTTGELWFQTNSTTRLAIGATGNVGIGTASPAERLEVKDTVNDVTLQVSATNTGKWANLYLVGSTTENYLTSNQDLSFYISGSERARIDSSGRLLVGASSTTWPYKIVAQGGVGFTAGAIAIARAQAGNAVTSGTDMGYITFGGNDNSTFAQISAWADNTTGSNDYPGRLVFSTTADAASSPTERMRIDSSGQVKIGTSSTPTGLGLEVHSTSNNSSVGTFYVLNEQSDAASPAAAFATATNSTATSNVLIKFGINSYGSGSGQINANGSGQCAFGSFSDERLKENITDLPSQWENIKNLRPVEFDYIESQGGEHQIGFIAQEFENVYPDAVGSSPMFVGAEEASDEERLTLTGWSKTEARLVKALQEAITKIETLEQRLTDAGL